MANKDEAEDWREIRKIYALLQKGDQAGWARVTRYNVEALITEAMADNNEELIRDLRDWK
jgi:ketosteroid isomerase-like protein